MSSKSLCAYGVLFFGTCIIDRLSKYAIVHFGRVYEITSFFSLHPVLNRGISWGFFHNVSHPAIAIFLTICIAAIIAMLMGYTYLRYREGYAVYAEVVVLAGAVSNFLDRILYGGVVDFLQVHIKHSSFPIFNVADIAIVVGIFSMAIINYREHHA